MATGRLHRRQVPTARRLSRIIKRASETTELQPLEPHPFAQLFPAISEEKVTELSRDIALHGQLEPIVLYQGKILDGVDRYKACRLINRGPWTIEFNPERVKRTPEEYVIAARKLG
jgi:hypothetical protein